MTEENEVMKVAESAAHGGMYLFIGNSISTGILAVCSIIIGRLLGSADYGLYSLAIVVPSVIIGVIDFGVTNAIIRYSAQFKSEKRDSSAVAVIKIGILFEFIVGFAASIACFIFSEQFASLMINRPDASIFVKAVAFLILFQTLFNGLSSAYIGLDKTKAFALIMTIRAIVKSSLSPLFIIIGFGVFGALVAHVSCYIVAVGIGIVALGLTLRTFKSSGTHSSSNVFSMMLKFGAPIYASGLIGLVLTQFQTIILAFFATNSQIGNFQVVTLFETGTGLLIYPFISLFPAFSKLSSQDYQIGQFFRRAVKYVSILMVSVSVLIAVLSKELISVLFGSDYVSAPEFLAFYMLLNLFTAFGNGVFGYLFNGIGRTDINLKSTIISFLLFLATATPLTYLFGVVGLIGSLFINALGSIIYLTYSARKIIGTTPDFRIAGKLFIAVFSCAAIVFAIGQLSTLGSILNILLCVVVFGFGLYNIAAAPWSINSYRYRNLLADVLEDQNFATLSQSCEFTREASSETAEDK